MKVDHLKLLFIWWIFLMRQFEKKNPPKLKMIKNLLGHMLN